VLINVTQEGQTEMADVIRDHLRRIERDAKQIDSKRETR
jgi:hypothetical protein